MATIGGTVSLAVQVTSDGTTLVNAASVVLTVRQPDNTLVLPTPSNPSTGNYTATFVPTQSGRHVYEWVATNPATTYTDMFEVDPAFSTAIVSLSDIKTQLQIAQTDTQYDNQLKGYVDAATAYVTGEVGPVVPQTYTEVHSGGKPWIVLYNPPVESVTSVTEYIGLTGYVCAQAELGGTGFYSYSLDDPAQGILTRRYNNLAGQWAPGVRNIAVTYVGGTLAIAGDVRLAALLDIQALFQQSQQGGASNAYGGEIGADSGSNWNWNVTPNNPAGEFPMLAALIAAPSRPPALA